MKKLGRSNFNGAVLHKCLNLPEKESLQESCKQSVSRGGLLPAHISVYKLAIDRLTPFPTLDTLCGTKHGITFHVELLDLATHN